MRKALFAVSLFCAAAAFFVRPPAVPAFAASRARYRQSEARLLDRNGQVLQELRVDSLGRRLEWTALKDVSPAMISAVLAAEDRRFYSHHGVDWRSLAAAVWQTARGRRRGASTITMQLASKLEPTLAPRARARNFRQKWRQLRYALALEQSWSKSEILETYLNLNLSRGELQGISALSRGLLGKQPSGLDLRESIVLAALLREPGASAQRVARRAGALARAMGAAEDAEALRQSVVRIAAKPPYVAPVANLAPEAARRLLFGPGPSEGPKVFRAASTLELNLQRFTRLALSARLREIEGENVSDAAALVVDNKTGEVLAYVGNGGASSGARFVDGITARRQAGSTLKPFLYALAFDRRVLTPASVLEDSPLELQVGPGLFRPNNYDNLFRGPVTARQALASSINVPAVRTLGLVGGEAFTSELTKLGFSELYSADFYGPSLALGTADVTLWDLTGAFRALANGGKYSPLRLSADAKAATPTRALSPQAAYLAASILSDREGRSSTFGLEGPLATPYWTAVKTGTSKDMRDNWCVGYSRRYTVGVWVGNFSGEPMWNVSGITGAAPVWAEVMNYLHADGAASAGAKAPPKGVVRRNSEWYLRGTEPLVEAESKTRAVEPANSQASPRIAYPKDEMVVAIDPDIPAQHQRIPLRATAGENLRWILNGLELGSAGATVLWRPVHGEQSLRLVDASNQVVDSVHFTVRGHDHHEP